MSMFIKLAWRNILRNKRRTFIAGTAIGIGLAATIFVDALFEGMERYMVRSATASFMGEAQVHRAGFRDTQSLELTVDDLEAVTGVLNDSPYVRRHTARTMSYSMLSSPANMSGVTLVGVDPGTERHLSQVDDAVVEGSFFDGDDGRDLLIGRKLAELLEVVVGDRVVITATQAHSGDLAQEMFRVSGIYHFNVEGLDRGMAFVRLGSAQTLLGLEAADVHEVAIAFTDPTLAGDVTLDIWDTLSAGENEALSWQELMPQLGVMMELSNFSIAITGIILFGVVALGIINTLFMSLYERLFEFGVLRAVGTRPRQLMRLVVFEAAALALVSIVLGAIFALVLTAIVGRTGIDYGGIEFAGVTFRDRIYPVLHAWQFIFYPACVLVLTTLVGLYPASHAARITPASAIRRSF